MGEEGDNEGVRERVKRGENVGGIQQPARRTE